MWNPYIFSNRKNTQIYEVGYSGHIQVILRNYITGPMIKWQHVLRSICDTLDSNQSIQGKQLLMLSLSTKYKDINEKDRTLTIEYMGISYTAIYSYQNIDIVFHPSPVIL